MLLVGLTAADAGTVPVAVTATVRSDGPDGIRDALGNTLRLESVVSLTSRDAAFGGLSGLWIAPDGGRLIAASDVGQRWEATLAHDDAGRLADVGDWSVADLPRHPEDSDGSRWRDAEALAGDGSGGLVLAYEGRHRLRRWPLEDLDATPEPVVFPDSMAEGLGGPSNSGIEALAVFEDGRLFALAERVGAWVGEGLMGWVVDGEDARDFVYVPGPGFAPTGAARLDDTIYVIERKFSLFGGFQSRIATISTDAVRPGARVEGAELAAFRWGDIGENFEGIAARRGSDGRILVYLLADDNFSIFQKTLLVQLSLSTDALLD